MNAVEIKIGTAVIGFGWAAFGLSILATVIVGAVVVADWGVAAAQAKVLEKGEEGLGRATGGRFNLSSFNNDLESHQKPENSQPSLGTSTMRGKFAGEALKLGTGLAKSAYNSHTRR